MEHVLPHELRSILGYLKTVECFQHHSLKLDRLTFSKGFKIKADNASGDFSLGHHVNVFVCFVGAVGWEITEDEHKLIMEIA